MNELTEVLIIREKATQGTERGPRTKECGQPRKAGKGKETDSSLQLPE